MAYGMRISYWILDVFSSDLKSVANPSADGPGAKGVSSHVRVILIWAGSCARLNARPRHLSRKDNRNPCGPRWEVGRSAAVPPAAGRAFFLKFLKPILKCNVCGQVALASRRLSGLCINL